ncbi:MAG: transposase [Nitriliruptor sp.]|jgi:transposase-like protein|uniref:transposase n=1 Tax=Nitriliruptor sp. TaxID=2448056 RepID=UPI0034A0699C
MAKGHPLEFRQRAVELARQREKPLRQLAADLGISDQTLSNWVKQADIDEGKREGLTTEERAELVQLRRRNRVLEMEIEILKRASAYFARENVLPK